MVDRGQRRYGWQLVRKKVKILKIEEKADGGGEGNHHDLRLLLAARRRGELERTRPCNVGSLWLANQPPQLRRSLLAHYWC